MATQPPAMTVDRSHSQPVTALYVGNLHSNVTETELSEAFSRMGDVKSVKICMDHTSTDQRSLGYGYVNYNNPQDAARALKELNFTKLNGKPIRISYSNKDSSSRRNSAGNIFVKNLDIAIDGKVLNEIFSSFGNIVSSNVETDAFGQSKGYGYVQYDTEEAAQRAINQQNGMSLYGKEVYVGHFISKQERENKTKFTNVFVKNLSESISEEDLKTIFGEFGSITSIAVMRNEDGKSKCFGFVNFENAEDAAKCVLFLNGKKFDDNEWYVGRAQKKSERERELRLKHEQAEKEARERSSGLNNLYIKNLDDSIDDDMLKELFSRFGVVKSCKVNYDAKGISKGSGFVAFSTPNEASRAISEMNKKMIGSKPLYVAIAERKEVRTARLQAQFSHAQPSTSVTPYIPLFTPGNPGPGQQIFYGHAGPSIIPPMFVQGMRPTGSFLPNIFLPLVQPGPPGSYPVGRRTSVDSVQQSLQPFPMMQQQVISRGRAYQNPLHNVSVQGFSGDMGSLSRRNWQPTTA